MGNHQEHEEIKEKIKSFEVIQKGSHYSILKDNEGNEYIKFLYAISDHDNSQEHDLKDIKANSIFNKAYLKYRFEERNGKSKTTMLPKIVAFGEEAEGLDIISCSTNKINFVIFEHPYKRTLKHEVEARIATGATFEEYQLLKLIKSICEGLTEYFEHITNWNPQIMERKIFNLTEDNIFIKNNGEFLLSDVISHLNRIEQISKQEVTLSKSTRSKSMTSLHAKVSSKKLKQRFFELNFNNLASIVESIIFKFECFSHSCKNSQESQSLSTALESHRGMSKNQSNQSNSLEKILKELRQPFASENQVIDSIERILGTVHLPTPIETSLNFSNVFERKNSTEKSAIHHGETLKLSEVNEFNIKRQPLGEVTQSSNFQNNQESLEISEKLINKRFSHHLPETGSSINENKNLKKSKSKLRLSLKKNSEISNEVQETENKANYSIERKLSHPKFILQKIIEKNEINKENKPISFKINPIGFLEVNNTSNKENSKNTIQNVFNEKLKEIEKIQESIIKDKKKVFLRKPLKDETIQLSSQSENKNEETTESSIHLNPMSRKKNLGANKLFTFKSKETVPVFKTIEKGSTEADLDLIDNLSSIMSNQNNTLSSYGIPATEEFKTENSLIEEEGCIGFNEILELETGKSKPKETKGKENELFSPSCVKLSSYPSIEMVESILERPEEKIPEFLKKYKLPEKHLMALNNIILTQKDVIVEESFEQSDLNSIRHSIPNILSLDEDLPDLKKKRNSKLILGKIDQMIKKEEQESQINGEQTNILSFEESIKLQINELENNCNNTFDKQLESIEISLAN